MNVRLRKTLFCFILLLFGQALIAQDLLDELGKEEVPKEQITKATFKATRLVNMHTVETLGKRSLDFRIAHHFGNLGSGPETFWGLDNAAAIRIALEYSYNGRLMGGIGRTSQGKLADGFLKYRLLRQTDGGSMPISITLFSSMYYTLEKSFVVNGIDKYGDRANRFTYCSQIMIARKFSESFSLQVSPTYTHFNLVERIGQTNDVWALAGLARMKMTKRSALVLEYTHNFNIYPNQGSLKYYSPFGIGYEIETGGHVFQMFFTNASGIAEPQTISNTTTSFDNWGLGLGFNISRVFRL
jgi:hypothetical protein